MGFIDWLILIVLLVSSFWDTARELPPCWFVWQARSHFFTDWANLSSRAQCAGGNFKVGLVLSSILAAILIVVASVIVLRILENLHQGAESHSLVHAQPLFGFGDGLFQRTAGGDHHHGFAGLHAKAVRALERPRQSPCLRCFGRFQGRYVRQPQNEGTRSF